jgi:uncharacterized protein
MKIATVILLTFFSLQAIAAVEGRTISVNGQCIKKVAPDRGTVTLVAQFIDKNATVSSRKAMQTYEKIREAVQKMNLKDLELQTSEYSVHEAFEYRKDKQISTGMQASLGLQITTSDITRLGEVAALSSQFEINRVENLSTFLSPERSKVSRESCLVEAIKNAREKAEKMAQSAMAKIGDVQLIDENPKDSVEPLRFAAMGSDSGAEAKSKISPTIESKPETISVNVAVTFRLK